MLETAKVTISRQWHNPTIKTMVTLEGIVIECALADFAEALVQEIGPVTWTFSDRQFRVKFDAAVQRVLDGIKAETAKVMAHV